MEYGVSTPLDASLSPILFGPIGISVDEDKFLLCRSLVEKRVYDILVDTYSGRRWTHSSTPIIARRGQNINEAVVKPVPTFFYIASWNTFYNCYAHKLTSSHFNRCLGISSFFLWKGIGKSDKYGFFSNFKLEKSENGRISTLI